MLLFNTLLNITGSMTRDDFIALVFEWNRTSEYRENIIENLEYHGEKEIRYGDENLSLEIQTLNCPDITAVRYSKKTEDGVVWTTDYVMNFDERKMAVRLDRSDSPLPFPEESGAGIVAMESSRSDGVYQTKAELSQSSLSTA